MIGSIDRDDGIREREDKGEDAGERDSPVLHRERHEAVVLGDVAFQDIGARA